MQCAVKMCDWRLQKCCVYINSMGRGQSMIRLNANITIKLHALNMQHFSLKAFKAFPDYAV